MQAGFGQQGATAQPGHSLMIIVAVVVVLVLLSSLIWYFKRTRGGRRAP
jgi:hypothetical protein